MLTHEQTTVRLRDSEISRLRKENEQLTNKAQRLKGALIEIMRCAAKDMNQTYKMKMLKMADEVERDV